jgi:hypothetical protein
MSRGDGWAELDRHEARMFRVHYGHGRQTSEVFETVAEAVEHLNGMVGQDWAYIQHRQDGQWVTYRGPRV